MKTDKEKLKFAARMLAKIVLICGQRKTDPEIHMIAKTGLIKLTGSGFFLDQPGPCSCDKRFKEATGWEFCIHCGQKL